MNPNHTLMVVCRSALFYIEELEKLYEQITKKQDSNMRTRQKWEKMKVEINKVINDE